MGRDNIFDIDPQNSGANTHSGYEAQNTPQKASLKKHRRPTQFNITILEERPLFREGLAHLLATLEPNWHVTSYSNEEMLMTGGKYKRAAMPSLVIICIDSRCCKLHDIELKIRGTYIDVPVLILMDVEDIELACAYLESGAKGIITPLLDSKIIIMAISLVCAGGVYVPPFFVTECMNIVQRRNNVNYYSESRSIKGISESSELSKDAFTPRQWDVLNLICQGLPNKIIARSLNMQECSVKAHVRHLMKKLGAQNRTQIACMAAHSAER